MAGGALEIIGGKIAGAALTKAVTRAHEAYLERGRAILEDELAKGGKTVQDIADNDKAAARVFDYGVAATKGKARRNLRLLAQLIVSELRTPAIYPDTFTELFALVADLSYQEMVVLSRYHAIYRATKDAPPNGAWSDIRNTLVGNVLESDDELLSIVQGLARTGLLFQRSNGPGTDQPSPKMFRLMHLVDLEGALGESTE